MTNEPLVPIIDRTLSLIKLLLENPEGLSTQELILQVDAPRSSLFQLLRALKNLGFIEQVEKRGRYRAGARLQSWQISALPGSQDIITAFYQEVSRQSWEETAALVLPSHNGNLIVAQVEGSKTMRCVYTIGQEVTHPDSVTAVFSPSPDSVLQTEGYCLEVHEEQIDLTFPICRDGSHPLAALLLSVPAARWQRDSLISTWVAELRAAAARLSYRLGATYYAPYQALEKELMPSATPLNQEEISHFLQGPWAARLACIRPDGKPHVVPVWQEWNGKVFYIVAWRGSQWEQYLQTNPNISMTIDEPWPPLRRIVVRGMAIPQEKPTPAFLNHLLDRLSKRYLGVASGAQYLPQFARLFSIQPQHLRGWQGLPQGPDSNPLQRSTDTAG